MAQILDAAEQRVVDILENSRGSASSFSAAARSLAITLGRFRRSQLAASLRDSSYDPSAFDQAYEIDWQRTQDLVPNDNIDGSVLVDAWFNLLVGHVYGANSTAWVDGNAVSITTANAVKYVKKRALSTAGRISQTLTYPEIVQDTTTDPKIWDCRPDGAATLEDLGGGRLLSVTPYVIRLYLSTLTPYDPTSSS